MADDKSKIGWQDRSKISSTEPYEVDYAAKDYGVSKEILLQAISAVGNGRANVEAWLRKNGHIK